MPRKHPPEVVQQAVALGAVVGSEDAAKRLGLDPRTVRTWMGKAGRAPADAITSPDWATLGELARTQVQADLVSGKVKPKDAAVIAAIADRNAAKVTEGPPDTAPSAHAAYNDWLVSDPILDKLGIDVEAIADGTEPFPSPLAELLRRANAEPGQPHREAMLAWFSGRTEFPAGDVLEWAKDQTRRILAEHGSLPRLREWEKAQREATSRGLGTPFADSRAHRSPTCY